MDRVCEILRLRFRQSGGRMADPGAASMIPNPHPPDLDDEQRRTACLLRRDRPGDLGVDGQDPTIARRRAGRGNLGRGEHGREFAFARWNDETLATLAAFPGLAREIILDGDY